MKSTSPRWSGSMRTRAPVLASLVSSLSCSASQTRRSLPTFVFWCNRTNGPRASDRQLVQLSTGTGSSTARNSKSPRTASPWAEQWPSSSNASSPAMTSRGSFSSERATWRSSGLVATASRSSTFTGKMHRGLLFACQTRPRRFSSELPFPSLFHHGTRQRTCGVGRSQTHPPYRTSARRSILVRPMNPASGSMTMPEAGAADL